MIRFMTNEAEKLMKGSVHEDDLFIVHDALVSMADKEDYFNFYTHLSPYL